MTRYWQETHPTAFKKGTNDFARYYGLLIDGLQMGYVNGFGYRRLLPAPEAEIPERFQRAEQVFGVEPAAHRHHRRTDVGEVGPRVARLPEFVVIRVCHHLVPEGDVALVVFLIGVGQRPHL